MKQLKHKFKRSFKRSKYDIDINIVTITDLCIFCNKTGRELHDISIIKNEGLNEININSRSYNRSFKTDSDLYDKYSPCLTEEEFLIKNIIE